jgi:light-regulated signal transduction histidine kinase (bacteriophytochrome)
VGTDLACTSERGSHYPRKDRLIAVSDNRQGFDISQASRILQPFSRLNTGKAAGTGLGLAISKRIVERNGGEIWAMSEPGAGSVFSFADPDGAGNAPGGGRAERNVALRFGPIRRECTQSGD